MPAPDPMYVCVDIIVYCRSTDTVLLIRRKNEPFEGKYALPGGYVDLSETVGDAARRELLEETKVKLFRQPGFYREYSDPGRDPRGRTISLVHYVLLGQEVVPEAGDDARSVAWCSSHIVASENLLAFDHRQILTDFLADYFSGKLADHFNLAYVEGVHNIGGHT